MKVLVDTCGWIEWLTAGKQADFFGDYLKKTHTLVVPTILQFELYKWVCRERDENLALEVIGLTEQGMVIPFDTSAALHAADIARQHRLAMADAIIYSTALRHNAVLVSADQHFSKLPDVRFPSSPR